MRYAAPILAAALIVLAFTMRPRAQTIKGQEITDHYRTMLRYQIRMDGNVPDHSVIFIGDSLTEGLCTDAVISPSVNYGIGSDTTAGVLARLPEYHSLERAAAVVLEIGVNDMNFRSNAEIIQNYRRILKSFPDGVPVICVGVLPVNESIYHGPAVTNARIRDLNAAIKTLCSENPHWLFLDSGASLVDNAGNLSAPFQDGDGIHLNSAGNRIWIERLKSVATHLATPNRACGNVK